MFRQQLTPAMQGVSNQMARRGIDIKSTPGQTGLGSAFTDVASNILAMQQGLEAQRAQALSGLGAQQASAQNALMGNLLSNLLGADISYQLRQPELMASLIPQVGGITYQEDPSTMYRAFLSSIMPAIL